MDYQIFLEKAMEWSLTTGLRLILIIILALVVLRLARMVINRIFKSIKPDDDNESQKRLDTLQSVLRYSISVMILVVAVMMVLDVLKINIGPVLAAAGIVGLAVGFGAQQLVQDIISGFFILMGNQIRVGDVVSIAGQAGLVEHVNLRMTILRDTAGSVHYVRNGTIDIVTNMTKDFSFAVFEIGVGYGEDIDKVTEIIREIGEQLRSEPEYKADILEPIEIWGLDKFADSAIIIKARIKTKPIKQWGIARAFNLRLKKKFDEKNIEIPFPHLTVYAGVNKQGETPPLRVSVEKRE